MSNTNTICKEILNSKDVTAQRVTEVLLTELAGPGHLKKAEVATLSQKVSMILNGQTDQLIQRVMKLNS